MAGEGSWVVPCWAVVVIRSATLMSDPIGVQSAAGIAPTFVTPTRLAREAGVAVAFGMFMRRFLLPNISCASFFGSVPSISCASLALRSFRPAQCQLRSPTAAEPLQTYLLAKLRRKKRPLSSCPPSCLSDSRERTKYGRCGSNANGLPDLCGFFVVMTARESFKKARLQGWKLRGLAAARPETPAEPQSRYDSRSTSQFSTSIL